MTYICDPGACPHATDATNQYMQALRLQIPGYGQCWHESAARLPHTGRFRGAQTDPCLHTRSPAFNKRHESMRSPFTNVPLRLLKKRSETLSPLTCAWV